MDDNKSATSVSAKLKAAIEYAAQGFRVIPCNDQKKPRVAGWRKGSNADPAQIKRWWDMWPSANVGIVTGEASGLLVLDIDVKAGGNGFVELEAFLGYPVEDIQAPRYSTPSGGQQLWFRYPKDDDVGICTKAHIGGLSIDTRANGGYCLSPPSETPAGRYEWIVGLEEIDELPQCPAELLDQLREPGQQKSGNANAGHSLSAVADTEGHSLETHPGACEGLRNGLLVVLVGKWLADHPRADWEELKPLVEAWNERCKPPKSAALVLKSAQHIWGKEQDAPKLKSVSLQTAELEGTPTRNGQPKPKTGMQLLVRAASTVKPQPVEWLWLKHLQAKAISIIAGPEGKGKSLLAADCAARVSRGGSWPDGTYPPRGRVLYCSAEEDASTTVVPRLTAAGADLDFIDIVDGLGHAGDDPDDALAIDLQQHLPQVYEQLKSRGDYRLCVWDTFQSVSLQTEHKSNTNQKQVAQPLARMAVELNLTMLCIEHHARSGFQRGNPDNAILGAGLVRTARAIWHVLEDPDDDTTRLFLPGKLNNANKDAEDLSWRFGFRELAVSMEGREVSVPAIDWLEASGKTLNEVRDAAIGTRGSPADRTTNTKRHGTISRSS